MPRLSRSGLLTIPGIGLALLPKLACPMCWPLYAGILSSLGLGFLIGTAYLVPITIGFLAAAVVALGSRAKQRRGFGPLAIGIGGSAAILLGKFWADSILATYGGVIVLVAASIWNVWPRRLAAACSCNPKRQGEKSGSVGDYQEQER